MRTTSRYSSAVFDHDVPDGVGLAQLAVDVARDLLELVALSRGSNPRSTRS
jgi:hypothetical protein